MTLYLTSLCPLLRILNRQEVLNRVKVEACEGKREMERYMEVERAYFSKTQERENLRTRLEVLRLQLAEQQKMEREGTCTFTKSNHLKCIIYSCMKRRCFQGVSTKF